MSEDHKFYALVHPGGIGGVVRGKPRMRKQDRRAKPGEMYAVLFFPKITGIGPAYIGMYELRQSLAQTPEAAKVKFMDGIARGQTWETYHDAGHRVRRVRISDLGDAYASAIDSPAGIETAQQARREPPERDGDSRDAQGDLT